MWAFGVHAAEEVRGHNDRSEGGPRVLCQGLTERINCMIWPQMGQSGVEQAGAGLGKGSESPKFKGLPEWSWTRIRLALAVGWQNP